MSLTEFKSVKRRLNSNSLNHLFVSWQLPCVLEMGVFSSFYLKSVDTRSIFYVHFSDFTLSFSDVQLDAVYAMLISIFHKCLNIC